MSNKIPFKIKTTLICLLISIFLSLLFSQLPQIQKLQTKIWDNLQGKIPAIQNIVIVEIDEKTILEITEPKNWLINELNTTLNQLTNLGAEQTTINTKHYSIRIESQLSSIDNTLLNFKKIFTISNDVFENANNINTTKFINVTKESTLLESLPNTIATSAALFPDEDQIIRQAPTIFENPFGNEIPSTSYAIYSNQPTAKPLPKFESNRFFINYSDLKYPSISFIDLYNGEVQMDLTDKIILIGDTSPYATDKLITPLNSDLKYPQIYIQAAALQTLLTGNFLFTIPKPIEFLILFTLILLSTLFFQFTQIKISAPTLVPSTST